MFIYIILGFIGGILLAYIILKLLSNPKKELPEESSLLLLQNQIQELNKTINNQLKESNQVAREAVERIAKLDSTNKQVVNFADQLKHLQDILKNPKQRGVLGEYYLENVLKNVLPPDTFQLQYEFKDGTKVDAVIFIKDKIIPIDSKFSLENYNRLIDASDPSEQKRLEDLFTNDLKTRIEETAKYIKPDEGTMDFAFMFIPSEAIYYDLLVNKVGNIKANTQSLVEYAIRQKRVIIVSPTSFLAYLQTVLQGLRAFQIEKSAQQIKKKIEGLGKHLSSYQAFLQKLGNHLATTVSMYNSASKEFKKIDKDIYRITDNKIGADTLELEKPDNED